MKLHARVVGEGEDVLILHGLFGMSDNWNTLGKRWAEDCGMKMHMLDLRNHGKSPHGSEHSYKAMAEDVVEYLDDNNIEKAILLGHSMGGKVAMRLAVDHSERVEKMVVVDIAPKGYPVHHQEYIDAMRTLDFSVIKGRKEADEKLAESVSSFMLRQFFLKSLHRENGQLAWRYNLDAIEENIEMVGEAMELHVHYDGEVLFIRGANSGYILDDDIDLIHHHFPKAKLHTVDGAGHWVHAEKPEEMYREVCDFLT